MLDLGNRVYLMVEIIKNKQSNFNLILVDLQIATTMGTFFKISRSKPLLNTVFV